MNVLFLCTGNSCRSQLAEAWAREISDKLGNPADWQMQSAGLEAHGLNSRAVKAMSRHGIDISQQTSDVLSPKMLDQADIVITVCDHADEHCPLVPPDKKKIHLPFIDPAKTTGTDTEIDACFDEVCLQIRDELNQLFEELGK